MPYVENLKGKLPDGYHMARLHASGKTWISERTFESAESAQETVNSWNEAIKDHDWNFLGQYYVWHRNM